MQLSNYYPVLITTSLIVGAIFALRIFFTLWAPVERRINGDRFATTQELNIDELKNKTVNIHLKSTTHIDGVVLLGYCSAHVASPYHLRQMLMTRSPDGRTAYIRIEEIEYIEQQPGNA
ncbi:MAG: hypothetical protein HZA46_08440 [Planctomycetales bacterium]|nr:hypothetical protein [Planctomycetales bacterium]